MERLITTREASRLTGYSQAGLRLYVKEGKLKVYRNAPRSQLRFKESDIQKFMNSGSSARK